MKAISSYLPSCKEVPQARVLLLGPVGSGKSSFISSVQSVFSGRVTNRAMVGSSSSSFTKKVQVKHRYVDKWISTNISNHPVRKVSNFCRPSCWVSLLYQLQSFKIHGHQGEDPKGLVLCDAMGLGNAEITGIPLHDILAIIKGHVPEGHRVSCSLLSAEL